MARWTRFVLNKLKVKNASDRLQGGKMAINRDPKATAVKRVGYQLVSSTGSSGSRDNFESPDVDFSEISVAISKDSYLMQASMRYKELIFKSGWTYQSKNQQALDYLKQRLDFMSIATGIPTEELFHEIANDIVDYSNAFIVKARAKNGKGLPQGLPATPMPPAKAPVVGYFRLPPETIQIARDANGNITKYKQSAGSNNTVEFRPEDIIHFKYNVPSGKAWGMPWITPVIEDVRLLRKIEEQASLVLYRHLFPLLVYTVGIAEQGLYADDQEIEELRASVEDIPTDGVLILPERHKVNAIDIKPMDGTPYLKYFEERVFSGTGLSQVDFGRGDTANRNTADAMSGNKVDRIKGWQESLMMQINKYMFEELLVEGGFDPVANPEFRVNFVFNEIELERKIAKESHEIFKFNNNVQTLEETRLALGKEINVDESRLHYNLFNGATPSQEASNKNQPENQNGKRSGPKRGTESFMESERRAFHNEYELFLKDVETCYTQIEESILQDLKKRQHTFPLPKTILASLAIDPKRLTPFIQNHLITQFEKGIEQAQKDMKKDASYQVNRSQVNVVIQDFYKHMEHVLKRLQKILEEKIKEVTSYSDAVLLIKSAFQSHKYKCKSISNDFLIKSYNYGYALFLKNTGESKAAVSVTNACSECQDKNMISLNQFSSLDEMAIYYRIPPWHPHCQCLISSIGGESK